MSKGTEVIVQGKLTHNSYEDKNGITRYVTEVVADQVMILSKQEA
jgi:single-strand DNA-binding protein